MLAVVILGAISTTLPMKYFERWLGGVLSISWLLLIIYAMILSGSAYLYFGLFLLFPSLIAAYINRITIFGLNVTTLAAFLVFFLSVTGRFNTTSDALMALVLISAFIGLLVVERAFFEDAITARLKQKRTLEKDKALVAQYEKINRFIDYLNEGLIATDNSGKVSLVNQKAIKILGKKRAPQSLMGQNADNLFTVSLESGEKYSVFGQVLKLRATIEREDLRLMNNKVSRVISISASAVKDTNGEAIGAICLFNDITEKYELDKQREEFNAITSHELRTPLSVIDGYLFNLMNNKSLIYDKQTEYYIKEVSESITSLMRLTNDILTVAKAENSQLTVALGKVDPVKIAKQVIKSLTEEPSYKKRRIDFVPPKRPIAITCDEQKLTEIITNLLDNALKFSGKKPVSLSLEEKRDYLAIAVSDQGSGISAEDQKRIFSKFYRSEDWRTRKTGGTGLGLYIVHTYLEALGGKIKIVSAPGKGSTFTVILPKVSEDNTLAIQKEKKVNEFISNL